MGKSGVCIAFLELSLTIRITYDATNFKILSNVTHPPTLSFMSRFLRRDLSTYQLPAQSSGPPTTSKQSLCFTEWPYLMHTKIKRCLQRPSQSKLKLFLILIKDDDMKNYPIFSISTTLWRRMGVKEYLHEFLATALDGGEWSAWLSGHFTFGGKRPGYPFDRRLGGPESRFGRGGEEKNFQPLPGSEPRSSSS